MRGVIGCAVYMLMGLTPLPGLSSGGVASLTPAQQAISDAASIQDPEKRDEALRQAIQEGLFSPDRATRDGVFSYLSQNSRWLDLRPCAEIIEAFGRSDPHGRGNRLLDDGDLARSPREQRLAVYREAIQTGHVKMKRGDVLDRFSAMQAAVLDGIEELRPLIARYYDQLPKELQARAPYGQLMVFLDLGEGGADRSDVARLASERLADMDETLFQAKMENDPGFRGAVLQVARYVCAGNPYSGRRNPGCAKMKEVTRRQIELEKRAPKTQTEVSASEAPEVQGSVNWLAGLKHVVP